MGLAAFVALSGCTGDLSALDPAGPSAASIARLWWVMLIASILLFILVVGLFLATVFVPKFGRRLSPRFWIVGGGLVLPLPILFALTFYAFWQGEYLLRGGTDHTGDTIRIEAKATRWAWNFRYPEHFEAAVSEGVLHIPAGVTVELAVTSDDVIHSLWIPRLGGKIDAVPGHTTYLRLKADRPGRFGGQCAEYCGAGHAGMRFLVQAHAETDYAAALAQEEIR
ncbi:Cytochrome c oxidase subunit II (fragment) [Pseudorhizobium banfieldiae]|uniref:cytochrome-c oxidase n=2 Tax=Pseudorhizobium banfieldiae TaxID=1125847 RepID=L0NK03_9HYPH